MSTLLSAKIRSPVGFLNNRTITKMIPQKNWLRIKFMVFHQQSVPALQISCQE